MEGDDALFIVHEAVRRTQRKGVHVQCPTGHLGDGLKELSAGIHLHTAHGS